VLLPDTPQIAPTYFFKFSWLHGYNLDYSGRKSNSVVVVILWWPALNEFAGRKLSFSHTVPLGSPTGYFEMTQFLAICTIFIYCGTTHNICM